MKALVLGAALLVAFADASAQERDTMRAPAPRLDSMRVSAPGQIGSPFAARDTARRPPYKLPPLAKAIADHPHNKLIHFPIVLTLVAATVLLVARKRPELEPVAFWLVWAAAVSVIPAYFTGQAQEKNFEGKPKEWLVELHEKQGITIGIVQALWVLSLLKAGTRRFSWIIGLALAVMVLAAGFLGGLAAHGR